MSSEHRAPVFQYFTNFLIFQVCFKVLFRMNSTIKNLDDNLMNYLQLSRRDVDKKTKYL